MNYLIRYFNYLNEYTTCYVGAETLQECLEKFQRTFELDEEPLPEKFEIYQLVYKNEL